MQPVVSLASFYHLVIQEQPLTTLIDLIPLRDIPAHCSLTHGECPDRATVNIPNRSPGEQGILDAMNSYAAWNGGQHIHDVIERGSDGPEW